MNYFFVRKQLVKVIAGGVNNIVALGFAA